MTDAQIYYQNNKELIKERQKERYKIHRDEILKYQSVYAKTDHAKLVRKEFARKYYEANKDKINKRERDNRLKKKISKHPLEKHPLVNLVIPLVNLEKHPLEKIKVNPYGYDFNLSLM